MCTIILKSVVEVIAVADTSHYQYHNALSISSKKRPVSKTTGPQ